MNGAELRLLSFALAVFACATADRENAPADPSRWRAEAT